jgi:hypothetical protein
MNREPDRRLDGMRPLHAVPPMRRNVDEGARLKQDGFGSVVEREPRLAAKKQNPLTVRLIVPEPGRARLPVRYDSFDPHAGTREQVSELFDSPVARQIEKDVS